MARYSFGGEITHLMVRADGALGGALKVDAGVTITWYDAVGGAAVTDFLLWDAATNTYPAPPEGGSIKGTSGGYLPRFQAADGLQYLWTQGTDGTWLRLASNDILEELVAQAEAARDAAIAASGSTAGVTSITQAVPGTPQTGAVTLTPVSLGAAEDDHNHVVSDVADAGTVGVQLMLANDAATGRTAIGAWESTLSPLRVMALFPYSAVGDARPTARTDVSVVWFNSSATTQPTNMILNDLWVTSAT